MSHCLLSSHSNRGKPEMTSTSKPVYVVVKDGGPVVITSSTSEFQILPSGYVQASLLKGGHRLTLDEVEQDKVPNGDFVTIDGKVTSFVLDFGGTRIQIGRAHV